MTENYTSEAARALLLSALPEAPPGKRTAEEEDAYLRGAVAIAEYVIDRWTLEAAVLSGYEAITPQLRRRAKNRLDECSGKHFAALAADATTNLDRYVKRHSHVMATADVAQGAEALRRHVVRSAFLGAAKFQKRLKTLEDTTVSLQTTIRSTHPDKNVGLEVLKWISLALLAGPIGLAGVLLVAWAIVSANETASVKGASATADFFGYELVRKADKPEENAAGDKGQLADPGKKAIVGKPGG